MPGVNTVLNGKDSGSQILGSSSVHGGAISTGYYKTTELN